MTVYTLHLPEDKSVEVNNINLNGNFRHLRFYVASYDGQQVESRVRSIRSRRRRHRPDSRLRIAGSLSWVQRLRVYHNSA